MSGKRITSFYIDENVLDVFEQNCTNRSKYLEKLLKRELKL